MSPNSPAGPVTDDHRRSLMIALGLSLVLTTVQNFVPYGVVLAWPFILVSTVVHEIGHGLAAWFVGGNFLALRLSTDASGVAITQPPDSNWARAAIAAGGLVGPAILAALGFVFGRRPRSSRVLLFVGAVILLVILVRIDLHDFFGYALVGTLCIASGVIAIAARPWFAQFTLILLATQMASSVFIRGDYLFVQFIDDDPRRPSDVQQIASQLFLPYWFWGLVCGAISVAALWVGLRSIFGQGGRS